MIEASGSGSGQIMTDPGNKRFGSTTLNDKPKTIYEQIGQKYATALFKCKREDPPTKKLR
jgi:hypothetical protein